MPLDAGPNDRSCVQGPRHSPSQSQYMGIGWGIIVFFCLAPRPCSWLEDDSIQCYATNWLVFVSRCRTWPVLVMARVVAVAELPYAGPVY